jgi:isoleucyl-tRNA synthetase
MTADYKSTLFLPETAFPMKAGLPKREPEILARWHAIDLYRLMRMDAAGRPKFVLHDGPPYANGHIHNGTALNKILKDVINRSQQMMGRDADYVPGWDCHGLPIEWKVEERYRAEGRDKASVPIVEFRAECRAFAEHWLGIQREEFKRLGVIGRWYDPYTTMSYAAEAQIVRECLAFLMNGSLFKGSKPVMWSVVEETALAEAEIEYHDHTSTTIFVRFPLVSAEGPAAGADVVIWTTTPWTMPGNRAIAFSPEATYQRIRVTGVGEGASAKPGDELILAAPLSAATLAAAKVTGHELVAEFAGEALTGAIAAHPLRGKGYDFDVPLLAGGFVTMDTGTGFVHQAPGHGDDDFELCSAHGIAVPDTIGPDGVYYDHVPLFAGKRVLKADGSQGDADGAVIAALVDAGRLLARGRLVHSYPHSWRSKAPLIFRNTPQWFISMEKTGLRATALAEIDRTKFVPPQGRNRIHSMVASRPDWLISRQRAWGVPITLFVDRRTGEPLRDEKVNARIVAAVEAEGADAWFASDPARFLAPDHDPANFDRIDDILDVWFDSGSTHAFVLEKEPGLTWPADLYLEGSDQHRGWFQSSLLESCGTRGKAPFRAILTHGFVLDGEGRKMSKSLGNTVGPDQVAEQYGIDILRLWAAASDYSEDLRLSPEILKNTADSYRRLRNTIRFLLGNLAGFDESERLAPEEMPELERWVLHRLAELDVEVRTAYQGYEFHRGFTALFNFCTVDLSAVYLDIRKDALYCDPVSSVRRRAARTVLDTLFGAITAWLAPILCFTMEEAWASRFGEEAGSVHLRQFPAISAAWRDPALGTRWETVREVRRVVTGALEVERREKRIGSSLQAHPTIWLEDAVLAETVAGIDFAELAITSSVTVTHGKAPEGAFRLDDVPGVAVTAANAEGEKCARCWMVLPEVGHQAHHSDLCARCDDAVGTAADAA